MRITQHTDYSLRVLLYLGLKQRQASVGEISTAFHISRNHLAKVVHKLSLEGLIRSTKGKGGGIQLAVDPQTLKIGDVIKRLEPLDLLECFNTKTNTCPIQGVCRLEQILHQGKAAFIAELNRYTLHDFLKAGASRTERMRILGIEEL